MPRSPNSFLAHFNFFSFLGVTFVSSRSNPMIFIVLRAELLRQKDTPVAIGEPAEVVYVIQGPGLRRAHYMLQLRHQRLHAFDVIGVRMG